MLKIFMKTFFIQNKYFQHQVLIKDIAIVQQHGVSLALREVALSLIPTRVH